ncbi:hypothetical protein [Cellulomonas sp. SG140]|uniref:hypothetical protein n=1 Tax=Cellulomonas sp. SG140 TaxID=2976536 RepID=UPI0021E97A53|nr:hypothetical protein [Cellulomonas sp. SG140]
MALRLLDEGALARFRSYVTITRRNGWSCWEWTGKRDHMGYGRFWLDGAWRQAHRVAFVALQAEASSPMPRMRRRTIPADLPQLDHRCVNAACVRPSHLQPVTGAHNHRLRVLRGNYRTKPSLQRAAA